MLSDLTPEPSALVALGPAHRLGADAKSPAIHAEPAFLKGMVEVQDEGSQLAALFSGAKPGEQVVDLCAGAGGKTLALAAMMENKGQIYATDDDKRRLAPIHDRLERAGARNVQVRTPKSVGGEIDDLDGRCDLVLIDAPCTGTGTWRRNPDAKWRMRPGALEERMKEQADDPRPRGAAGEARRAHRLCDLLGARRGERRAGPCIPGAPSAICAGAAGRGRRARWASAPSCSRKAARLHGRRHSDDAAHDRHRWLLREPAALWRMSDIDFQSHGGETINSPIPPQSKQTISAKVSCLTVRLLPAEVLLPCWWRRAIPLPTSGRRMRRARVRAPAGAAGRLPMRGAARFMTVLQLAGSLLAIPVGLASAYSMYRANFSVETTCQSLRSNIVGMIDKQIDAGTRRMLARRREFREDLRRGRSGGGGSRRSPPSKTRSTVTRGAAAAAAAAAERRRGGVLEEQHRALRRRPPFQRSRRPRRPKPAPVGGEQRRQGELVHDAGEAGRLVERDARGRAGRVGRPPPRRPSRARAAVRMRAGGSDQAHARAASVRPTADELSPEQRGRRSALPPAERQWSAWKAKASPDRVELAEFSRCYLLTPGLTGVISIWRKLDLSAGACRGLDPRALSPT